MNEENNKNEIKNKKNKEQHAKKWAFFFMLMSLIIV